MQIFSWENFWNFFGACVVLFLALYLGTLVVSASFASGKITYCMIQSTDLNLLDDKGICISKKENGQCNSVAGFKLMGHVDYREDHRLGFYYKLDEALADAKKLNCPIEVK